MDRKTLNTTLSNILTEIEGLNGTLIASSFMDIAKEPDKYNILIMDSCFRAEKIACKIRNLICQSTGIRKMDLLKLVSLEHDIQIHQCAETGIIDVKFPSLLPKKRRSENSHFMLDALYAALDEYDNTFGFSKINDNVICMTHYYSSEASNKIRDYDNFETKDIIDLIATYTMVDDSGKYCTSFSCTKHGDDDFTCITILDKNLFPKWLVCSGFTSATNA